MATARATFEIDALDKTRRTFENIDRRMDRLKRSGANLGRAFGRLAKAGAAVGAALAGITAYALVRAVRETLTAVDRLAKTADRLGLATEALGGLRFAAEKAGADVKALDLGLQRMVRRISEAANGSDQLAKVFAELGLNAQELTRLTPDQAFLRIADAIAKIPSQADRVRLTFKIFDTEGVKLKNLLDAGSESIQQQIDKFAELGGAISRVDAAKIEQANDAMTDLGVALTGVKQELTVAVAPAIAVLSSRLSQAGAAGETMGEKIRNALRAVLLIAGRVGYGFEAMASIVAAAFLEAVVSIETAAMRIVRAIENAINAALGALNRFAKLVSKNTPFTIAGPGKIDFALDDQFEAAADGVERQAKLFQKRAAGAISDAIDGGEFQRALLKAERDIDKTAAAIAANAQALNNIDPSLFPEFSNLGEDGVGGSAGVAAAAAFDEAAAAADEYAQRLENLEDRARDLLATNRDRFDEEVRGWRLLLDNARINHDQFLALIDKSREANAEFSDAWRTTVGNMQNAWRGFLQSGELAWQEFLANLATDLATSELASLLERLGQNLQFGGSGSGFFGNLLGGLVGSFSGGGYTGNGSRSGGLDGRGGFLAMLHPRETVVDHTTAGQAGSVNIQQHITIRETVPADMARAIAQAGADQAKAEILRYKQGGGRRALAWT